MPVEKISSDQVEVGMYVASLDRPWSETPFLFQGFEVHEDFELEELKRLTEHVYIMVPDEKIEINGLSHQNSSSFLYSVPINADSYHDRASTSEEVDRVRQSHEEASKVLSDVEALIRSEHLFDLATIQKPMKIMVDSVVNNPDAYLWLTRIRKFDSFLYKDSLTAAVLGTSLGRKLGLNRKQLDTIAMGCLLMDVGMLSLPGELIHKEDRLSKDEWELVKSHVDLGLDTLDKNGVFLHEVHEIVRTHHERLDGSGYPNGLKGSEIPLFGQIAGIVDQYVSVTNKRPFATVVSASMAEKMLYSQRNRLFDEVLVEYFIQALGTYPTGSLVELSSGEVAAVVAQNPRFHLKPDVILILDENKRPYSVHTTASLETYMKNDKLVTVKRSLHDGEYGLNIEEVQL